MVSSQAWWQPKVKDKCLNHSRWQGLGKTAFTMCSYMRTHGVHVCAFRLCWLRGRCVCALHRCKCALEWRCSGADEPSRDTGACTLTKVYMKCNCAYTPICSCMTFRVQTLIATGGSLFVSCVCLCIPQGVHAWLCVTALVQRSPLAQACVSSVCASIRWVLVYLPV